MPFMALSVLPLVPVAFVAAEYVSVSTKVVTNDVLDEGTTLQRTGEIVKTHAARTASVLEHGAIGMSE